MPAADVGPILTAIAALVSAIAALVAAIQSHQNATTLHRVEGHVDGDLKRLSDHLLETRAELADAQEEYDRARRGRGAREVRQRLRRQPPARD